MKNKHQRVMISLMRQILKKMNAPLFVYPKSKHTFSIHQHIILPVLGQYESESYESFVEWLDGRDAEPVHKRIRGKNTISMIPTRNKDCLINRTKGGYRKLMRRVDYSLYHERNKTETMFSVVKRRFDSEIKSYDNTMKTKELLYRVLACCHRMCIISLVWIMISRKPRFGKS